jgi:hypothetical protein
VRTGKITEETAIAASENKKEMATILRGDKAPPAQAAAPAAPAGQAAQAAQGAQAKLGDLAARARNLFGGKG